MGQAGETRDVITIRGVYEEEIPAISVDLFVNIRGSSFLTGATALYKAREVAQLVSELKNAGLADNNIKLESVSAESVSGLLGKSSAANYSLRIHCADLEKMADLLGIITSQKNARLNQLQWHYNDEEPDYQRWLQRAIENANERAGVVAARLGVTLLGVHNFYDLAYPKPNQVDVPSHATSYPSPMRFRGGSEKQRTVELGLEISHTRTIALQVEVQYHISGFAATGSASGS